MAVAGILLTSPNLPMPWLYARFVESTPVTYFLGAVLATCGLAFRHHGGKKFWGVNWSGTVTLP